MITLSFPELGPVNLAVVNRDGVVRFVITVGELTERCSVAPSAAAYFAGVISGTAAKALGGMTDKLSVEYQRGWKVGEGAADA
jgi:hypothetical protein